MRERKLGVSEKKSGGRHTKQSMMNKAHWYSGPYSKCPYTNTIQHPMSTYPLNQKLCQNQTRAYKMKQGLLPWRSPCQCHHSLSLLSSSIPLSIPTTKLSRLSIITANTQELTARERRRLRNERRENNATTNWREQVEEKLMKKPKKRYKSWTDELNLDNLADLGPQWWVIRVARIRALETAETIARLLAKNFPDIDFKVI